MSVAAYSRFTEAGIRRRAAERRQAMLPALEATEAPKPVSEAVRAASNVIPFKRCAVPASTLPAVIESRAKAFLAGFRPLRRPKPEAVIEYVAWWHNLTSRDIIEPSRFPHLIEARFDAIAAVHLLCPLSGRELHPVRCSVPILGQIFKRDPQTCFHALRKRGLK